MEIRGNTVDEAAIRADIDMRARILLEVGLSCPHRFAKNGHVLAADIAFQSQPLVTNLLKSGLFSMNLGSMVEMEGQMNGKGISFSRVPSFLLAVGLHYAIEVAPLETMRTSSEPVISLDALQAQVNRLEETFGRIALDGSLVQAVSALARDRLDVMGPAPGKAEGLS